jgi:pimeloyl-ACP methyl ester carboxylesterase
MSNWFSGNVVANRIKLHYQRTGGDKPPLVLAHGITDKGLCWLRAAQVLEKDYDVIMVDARGHGLSDAPESGYTPAERAADLAGLIQALGLDKPYLMGHSMGADTTAITAATHPDLVGCAILEDPPWFKALLSAEAGKARTEEWRARMLERKSKTFEELVAAGREQQPTWADIEFGPWAEAKLQVSFNVLQGMSELGGHWRDTAAKITCPTLLITGNPDLGGLVTSQVAAEAKDLCPNLKVAHIEGAGHNIRREQFEQFINLVTAFLAELPEPGLQRV